MIEFYKEFYFKELNVKNQLNDSINIPIILLTGIITLHVFIYTSVSNPNVILFLNCVSFFNFFAILYSIWFLGKTYMNLGKAHLYKELNTMSKYLDAYEKFENNNKLKEFETNLKNEIAECASFNFEINKKRTEDLAQAKKALFLSISLSLLFSLIYIISLIFFKS